MKKLLFIALLIALIGCKTKQTIEQEKVQTESSISKSTMVDDSSIITIVYDMLEQNETTRKLPLLEQMIRPALQNRQIEIDIEKAKS